MPSRCLVWPETSVDYRLKSEICDGLIRLTRLTYADSLDQPHCMFHLFIGLRHFFSAKMAK